MAKPEKQTHKQEIHESEDEPPPDEKDHVMMDSNSDSKILLSCWWSRGPSGQVQEWESRPMTAQNTRRTDVQHRGSSSRWGTKLRNGRKSKT